MKLFNKKIWLPVFLSTGFLSVSLLSANKIANEYAEDVSNFLGLKTSRLVSGDTSKSQYYKSDYEDFESMYKAKTKLLRQIGEEGTVLLKNEDNVLPLKKNGKVTILNEASFIFAPETGGGSFKGKDIIKNKTTLTKALQLDGITVSSEESSIASSDAVIVVIGRSQGEGNDLPSGALALSETEKALIEKAKANENVIILISGEYSPEIDSLKKSSQIKGILKFGSAGMKGAYGLADVMTGLVSPSGKLVDTMAVSSLNNPAMVNYGEFEYSNKNKIMASQASKYVSYNEGIYTDYRYFETRYEDSVLNQGNATSKKGAGSASSWKYADQVSYGFGYGLSYSTFEEKIVGLEEKDSKTLTLKVEVTNTGSTKGKHVSQVYLQSPYTAYDIQNKVEKSAVKLVGFAKTAELDINGKETLAIDIDKSSLLSYDYTNAKSYILEGGNYYFALGNGAHDAVNNILAVKGKSMANGMTENGDSALVYTHVVKESDYDAFKSSVTDVKNRFDDVNLNYWLDDASKITYLSRSDWDATYPTAVKIAASDKMLASYNDIHKYENGVNNDLKDRVAEKDVNYQPYETEGDLSAALAHNKMERMNVVSLRGKDFDDAGWEKILDNLSLYEMSRIVAQSRFSIQSAQSVTFNEAAGHDGPSGVILPYKYFKIDPATGEKTPATDSMKVSDGITDDLSTITALDGGFYSAEPVLAATFNTRLAEEVGKMYGEDGLYTGSSYLFGLGQNLHRTAYNGRMAEYYSADPMLNGLIGARVSKACKEHGVVLVAKHFVLNEQEQNRIGVSTFTNEQALRELYLKPFELLTQKGELQGVMTAYNRIGVLSCTADYDLITGVLREEWNSKAYVISDLCSPTAGLYDGNAAIIAGLSTFLNNGTYNAATGSFTNTSLNTTNIKKDKRLLSTARNACHYILYNFIHSNAANDISADSYTEYITPWWKPTLLTLSIGFTVVAVASFGLLFTTVFLEEKKNEQ